MPDLSSIPNNPRARVYDVAEPDRYGTVIKAGPEVSEVRFDDGPERNISNVHLRAVETANVELDNPVLPATEPGEDVVRKGQEAWQRLRSNSTWPDWCAVGAAHVSGRAAAMRDGHVNKPKATYTKHFEAGVLVAKPLSLGIHKDQVECERLYLPSDGRRGGSTRVWKYYPLIESWQGDVEFIVVDETVLQKSKNDDRTVLETVLVGAGSFIGIGRFRPRNNGFYGRFDVAKMEIRE